MKRKWLGLVLLAGIALPIAALTPLTLSWDANDPAEGIQCYCVYEVKGTNFIKVATTTNTAWQIPVTSGFHAYSVTASNQWGEGPFCPTVSYIGASAPRGQRISRQ